MATTPTLRPLGVGEILDAGIKLYLRHWKPLMICVAGIVLPVQILSVLVFASVDRDSLDGFSSSSSGDVSWTEFAAFSGVALVAGLSTLLATAACFKAVADAWLGSTPEAGRSLRFAIRRLPALVWLAIVIGTALAFAFLAFVIPFIWLGVAWSLAVPAMLFERVGPITAMKRSFRLVRSRWWPILGALLVTYLLATIVGGIVQLVPAGIANSVSGDSVVADAIATVIGGTVSSLITTPYTAAILTLLYFDQRVRKEGFDLQLLASGLGAERDPDAPLPAPLIGPDYTPEQRAAAPFWPPPPGWVPPEPSAPAEPEHQWWQDPAPGDAATYGGGYARPQAPAEGAATRSEEPLPGAPPRPASGASPAAPGTPSAAPGASSAAPGGDPGEPSWPAYPGASSPGDPPPAPGDSPPAPGWSSRPPAGDSEDDSKDKPKRDPDRADWLPPEAPRGPGGL